MSVDKFGNLHSIINNWFRRNRVRRRIREFSPVDNVANFKDSEYKYVF